jgi:chemotaxis response regulator CheB
VTAELLAGVFEFDISRTRPVENVRPASGTAVEAVLAALHNSVARAALAPFSGMERDGTRQLMF